MSYLTEYEEIDGGYVAFEGDPKGGKITRKGKFDGKADEGFFVGYSLNSKAFRVFSSRIRTVEENMHIRKKESDNAGQARKKTEPIKDYILLPLWTAVPLFSQDPKSSHDDGSKHSCDDGKKVDEDPRKENKCNDQEKEDNIKSTNNVNTVCSTVNDAGINEDNELPFDPNMPALEDVSTFNFSSDNEDDGEMADMNNLFTKVKTASTPTESQNPLLKDEDGEEVDVHMYRSMSGSLMYITSSRLDIVFTVCACARYQVNPKVSHLYAVKMIF
nr:putative ribonuclease H-like domain-containing protein [Tanacetum cinerariifolium]